MAAFVGRGLDQLRARRLQRSESGLHVGLSRQGDAGAGDGTKRQTGDQDCCGRLGKKARHEPTSKVERADCPPAHDPKVGRMAMISNSSSASVKAQLPAYRYLAATDRLAADVTALSDAVTMLESMPTPHSTRPSLVSASMKLTAWASDPAPVACW